jgi:hypothetical protein
MLSGRNATVAVVIPSYNYGTERNLDELLEAYLRKHTAVMGSSWPMTDRPIVDLLKPCWSYRAETVELSISGKTTRAWLSPETGS